MLILSTAAVRFSAYAAKSGSCGIREYSAPRAEALLDQMLDKLDQLCAERDRLKKEQLGHNKGKALGGRQW